MSKRILIVEDELPIAELEKDYLELSGFEVVICSDGTEGMKMATTEKFDMVILDLMLPGTDGFEICKKIRETSEIPIMMVSAKKEDIDKIRGLGLGANDYMTKPFSPSELVARVKAHLERYKKLVGSAMKEFDLLFFLAQHPNRVFSKEELLEEVWQLSPVGADIATVTVHIKKIREKIEKDTQNPQYIETVWAVGYRFIVKEAE